MAKNLHRTPPKPQAELTPESERTLVQKVSVATKGFVNPAMAASYAGLALNLWGLNDIRKGKRVSGSVKLFAGRVLDVADGYLAEKFKVKSPRGETTDAAFDKISSAAAIGVMLTTGDVDMTSLSIIGAGEIAMAGLTAIGRKREVITHTPAEGKTGTFALWGKIISDVGAAEFYDCDMPKTGIALQALGAVAMGAFAQTLIPRLSGMQAQAFAPRTPENAL